VTTPRAERHAAANGGGDGRAERPPAAADPARAAAPGRPVSAAALLSTSKLPRPESRLLLAAVLGIPVEALIAHPELQIAAEAASRFAGLAARRLHGEPVAYLLGEKEFHGRRFAVAPAVLIPRPETELLVEVALARLRGRPAPRLLDLGTGCGCVAITLALERPDASVLAVDRFEEALRLARDNARRLAAGVEFQRSDWYAAVDGDFDAIVANPPYVAAGDPHLQALRHEPQRALVAGADGLDDLRRIVAGAPPHLRPGGWLAVEHGYEQGSAVRALFAAAGFVEVETRRDLAGVERVCIGSIASAR
jgi:release factor glutamine methyltransferase